MQLFGSFNTAKIVFFFPALLTFLHSTIHKYNPFKCYLLHINITYKVYIVTEKKELKQMWSLNRKKA